MEKSLHPLAWLRVCFARANVIASSAQGRVDASSPLPVVRLQESAWTSFALWQMAGLGLSHQLSGTTCTPERNPVGFHSHSIEQSQIVSPLPCASKIWVVLGGFSVPLGGCGIVLGHAFTILVHLSKCILRVWVTLFCRPSEPFQRFLKVRLSKPSPLNEAPNTFESSHHLFALLLTALTRLPDPHVRTRTLRRSFRVCL